MNADDIAVSLVEKDTDVKNDNSRDYANQILWETIQQKLCET